MKKYKDSIKTVAVLAIIALVSGLMLSYINSITQIDMDEEVLAKISEVYPQDIDKAIDLSLFNNKEESEILYAFLMKDGAYSIISHSKSAYSSYGLDMLIIIKDDKIKHLLPYHSEETPGIGSKALEASYLDKYIGLNIADYAQTQIGDDAGKIKGIDAFSGASRTANGVSNAVNGAIYLYRQVKGLEG